MFMLSTALAPRRLKRQLTRRVLFRRIALARCSQVIVPSKTLFQLVRDVWRLPANQITQIPNGIDVDRFGGQPDERTAIRVGNSA